LEAEITFEDWKKLEIRIGVVKSAEKVKKTEKLYKISVDIGEKTVQIVSSLAPYYKEEELLGKEIAVLTNLRAAKFGGEYSFGMLLCAEKEDGSECVLLSPEKSIGAGTRVT
jgi:tRNA-binding protein